MRRKDRQTSREDAELVIDTCAYAVMSTVNPDGAPYGIPLSIAREGECLYFHCAGEGQKIDNMRRLNRVCITCVGNIRIPQNAFTVEYESAVVTGTAEEVLEDREKLHALRLISRRYTPGHMAAFDTEAAKALPYTGIWKIHIDTVTGKSNKPKA